MDLLSIVELPNPLLHSVSKEVHVFDEELRELFEKMRRTMYQAQGIGIAAVQVGILKRLCVIDLQDNSRDWPWFMVNPKIITKSDSAILTQEGCLSVPQFSYQVARAKACTVRFCNEKGMEREESCEDLLARCVQHEIDHMDGVLYIDHLSKLKRDRVLKKFNRSK